MRCVGTIKIANINISQGEVNLCGNWPHITKKQCDKSFNKHEYGQGFWTAYFVSRVCARVFWQTFLGRFMSRARKGPFGAKAPLGQNWQKLKSVFEKTRVGFGSPELSLRLSCTEFCALSSGHGPRGLRFHGGPSGGIFAFLGVQQWNKNMKMKHAIGQISISGALDKCKLIS